jgi:WD40 repeat protein
VLIWSAASGALLQTLRAHKLTVVALAFAPPPAPGGDGAGAGGGGGRELLASASKDRSVALWEAADDGATFALAALADAAHKRIVWSLSWAPGGAAPPLLASGARDGVVKLWLAPDAAAASAAGAALAPVLALPTAATAVTAVAFAPARGGGGGGGGGSSGARHLLAVGEESGRLALWLVTYGPGGGNDDGAMACVATPLAALAERWQPAGAISRLAWQPRGAAAAGADARLAVASEDESLRVCVLRGW